MANSNVKLPWPKENKSGTSGKPSAVVRWKKKRAKPWRGQKDTKICKHLRSARQKKSERRTNGYQISCGKPGRNRDRVPGRYCSRSRRKTAEHSKTFSQRPNARKIG